MPFLDFREFFDALRANGELIEVDRAADLELEVAKAMRTSASVAGPAVMFTNNGTAFPGVGGAYGSRANTHRDKPCLQSLLTSSRCSTDSDDRADGRCPRCAGEARSAMLAAMGFKVRPKTVNVVDPTSTFRTARGRVGVGFSVAAGARCHHRRRSTFRPHLPPRGGRRTRYRGEW